MCECSSYLQQQQQQHDSWIFHFLKSTIQMINWFLQRNFLGRTILLLCDYKSWSSLANQLYHQSDDETERNEMKRDEMEKGKKKTGELGEKIDNIVEDFPIFLLFSVCWFILFHWGMMALLYMGGDRICVFFLSECECVHYFQFNSTHRWKKY